MGWRLARRHKHECCSTCKCLRYCATQNHDGIEHNSLTVLANRSFDDIDISAKQGCRFCDVLLQSFMLLQCVDRGMQVKILLHSQSPTELHSQANKAVYDVVEIYPCSADEKQFYPRVGTDVPRKSTLETSVHFLRENYFNCITDHEDCWQGPTLLPKRIVDISNDQYRLIEPLSGTTGKYACLSYSWGSKGFAMTTSKTYEGLKHGFDQNILPIAFREATMIVQKLGIHYLWIDTLCIIQDSPEDWMDHARNMCDIFEGATITIAASSIPNPDHPLFETRNPRYQEIELFSNTAGDLSDVVFKARKKIIQGIHAKVNRLAALDKPDPLDTRAWGLQERMLSTRVIAFTGSELQWTCRTLEACECHPIASPSRLLFPVLTEFSSKETVMKHFQSWSQIVEEYSSRKLTLQKDMLPALHGLVRKFGAITGYTDIRGLWKETLLYDLVWQNHNRPLMLSSIRLGPTFSWASSPGAVNFRLARRRYPGSRIEHAELINFYCNTDDLGANSKAVDGSLTLRGPTVAARLRRSAEGFEAYKICIDDAMYSPNTDQLAICEFSIDSFAPNHNLNPISDAPQRMSRETLFNTVDQDGGEPIILLSLYSIHHSKYLYQNFLILERSQNDIKSYTRIGVGSGKLYRANECEDHIPTSPDLVRPFEWLSVDLGERGRSIGGVTERVMCIR